MKKEQLLRNGEAALQDQMYVYLSFEIPNRQLYRVTLSTTFFILEHSTIQPPSSTTLLKELNPWLFKSEQLSRTSQCLFINHI